MLRNKEKWIREKKPVFKKKKIVLARNTYKECKYCPHLIEVKDIG
jgi:hypothetical protein